MAEPKDVSKRTIRFHYIKSPAFRTVHVDGGIGGPTPEADFLHVALYSERAAIPQQMEYYLNDDDTLGEPVPGGQVTRGGIVREMQVDAIMTWETAQRLHEWIGKHLSKRAHGTKG